LETTICHEIRQTAEAVIIDNVADDPVYCGHPTPALYGFRSYISVPITRKNGVFFGTLCAIDPRPAKLKNTQTIGMFKLFAELIAYHIESEMSLRTSRSDLALSNENLRVAKAELVEEKYTAELREQFIAVLGHDLRNPLSSLSGGLRLLQKDPPSDRRKLLIEMLQGSVVRMSVLIDNVLDFA